MAVERQKEIRSYFFSIALPTGTSISEFKAFFHSLYSGEKEARILSISGSRHLLVPLKIANDGYYFALAKERDGGWPYILDDDASVKLVSLASGTLGELTVYWISPDRSILVEAYNHHAPRPNSLKAFLIEAGNPKGISLLNMDFFHMLNEQAYRQFAAMDFYKKLIYKIANPDPLFIDKLAEDGDLKHNLELLRSGKAIAIDVTLSVGNSKRMLDVSYVNKAVNLLRKMAGVGKLKVTGGQEASKATKEVNLLDDRLIHKEIRKMTGKYITFDDYTSVISNGILLHDDYLNNLNPTFHNQ